ncbi:TonB-dependent receptor domain-containing protein [Sphingomonas sp. Root710]|uniref:TonB-dependent receptor domain-containing protein n=1 Tax=Sphingomonas sp. Root710 TaxID=1736594 RepID=UPI002AA2AD95|nr:TonB-dependent receptor [Sphingomonas sp. Root710]
MFAQQDGATPPAAVDGSQAEGGDIVVTGTLIRNPNLTSSSPISIVGQQEIALRQNNNAEELLRTLPGAVPSIGSAVNNGNAGASYADLRGLGNFRNIVLLDGARIAPADAVGRVDLNNIPVSLIQRVDTLTGGAATTYGADAVSGVINFVTRKDFSGVELNASKQITSRGDAGGTRVDLTLGGNLDGGRGNVVLSIGYLKNDAVYQDARDISYSPYESFSGTLNNSSTTVPSRFTVGNVSQVINPATGALTPYVGSRDGFNINPYNLFQTPFKRYNAYAAAHYDISDSVQVYARGMYSKNTINVIVAPSGLAGSAALIPYSNPYLPDAARATFCANNQAYAFTSGAPVAVGTLTPAQCAAAATATSVSDPNFRAFSTSIGRRSTEIGPRNSQYVTELFDYRAGVKVNITEAIDLDVSGSYGESENRVSSSGYLLTSRARTALWATNTTTCLGSSPAVPGIGGGASASGCVPLNVFGPDGSINAAQAGYISGSTSRRYFTKLGQARALLSGSIGASSPWADKPISFAAGMEYRNYRSGQDADQLAQTNGELGLTGATIPFRGGYDVTEGYGEVIAPVISDKPGFKSLTLEAGVRYSHYKVDTAGSPTFSATTYKGGATWEPIDGVKFRGNYQHAVRAPNVAELFTPQSLTSANIPADPCAGAAPLSNADLRAVCLAQGAPVGAIGSITNPQLGQANATSGGNTALKPEKADTYTLGVVLQPRGLVPGLSVTVDYYHIRINRAISQANPSDALASCFGNLTGDSASSPFCTAIRRNPVTGTLDGDPATTPGLSFVATNQGTILTDGIDLGVNYDRDLGFAKLSLGFQGNWTHRSKFRATPASIFRECVGYYSTNCGSPGSAGPSSAAGSLQPEYSWNQRTTLSFGDVDISLLWRHLSSMKYEPGLGKLFAGTLTTGVLAGEAVDFGRIKAYDYFDLAGHIDVTEHLDLTLTVTNLFDKKPPIVGGNAGTSTFNSGNTFPSTYDALGRRFAVGARVRF